MNILSKKMPFIYEENYYLHKSLNYAIYMVLVLSFATYSLHWSCPSRGPSGSPESKQSLTQPLADFKLCAV